LLRSHLIPIREAPALRIVNAQLLLLAIVSALELRVFADRHWSDWSDRGRGHWSAAEALRIPLVLDVAPEACRTFLRARAIAPLLNLASDHWSAAEALRIPLVLDVAREACRTRLPTSAIAPLLNLADSAAATGFGITGLILMMIMLVMVVMVVMVVIFVRGLGNARNLRLLIGDLDRSILI